MGLAELPPVFGVQRRQRPLRPRLFRGRTSGLLQSICLRAFLRHGRRRAASTLDWLNSDDCTQHHPVADLRARHFRLPVARPSHTRNRGDLRGCLGVRESYPDAQIGSSFTDITTAELVLGGWLLLGAAVRAPSLGRIVGAGFSSVSPPR